MSLKIVFTIVLLAFSMFALAQERFIEVVVMDSLLLEADEFKYTLLSEQDYEVENPNIQSSTRIANSIKTVIDKYPSVSFEAKQTNNYAILPQAHMQPAKIVLDVQGKKALRQLYEELKNIQGVYAYVSSATSSTAADSEVQLIEKLLKKAKTKASKIATLTGQEIGKMVSFSESGYELNQYFSEIFIGGDYLSSLGIKSVPINIPLAKQISVKFAVQQ